MVGGILRSDHLPAAAVICQISVKFSAVTVEKDDSVFCIQLASRIRALTHGHNHSRDLEHTGRRIEHRSKMWRM